MISNVYEVSEISQSLLFSLTTFFETLRSDTDHDSVANDNSQFILIGRELKKKKAKVNEEKHFRDLKT